MSVDGLARLHEEHATLVARRPGVVSRIRAAKELVHLTTPGPIGLASVVAPLTTYIEETHPDLTLQGLRIAAGYLGLKW